MPLLTKSETDNLVYAFLEPIFQDDLVERQVHSRSENGSDITSDITFGCPDDGEVRVASSGLVQETDSTFSLAGSGTLIPQSCVSGEFVLTGNPSIEFTLGIYIDITDLEAPDAEIKGDFNGTLDWDYLDRSGTCQWELNLQSIFTSDNFEVYLRGQACGNDLDLDARHIFLDE